MIANSKNSKYIFFLLIIIFLTHCKVDFEEKLIELQTNKNPLVAIDELCDSQKFCEYKISETGFTYADNIIKIKGHVINEKEVKSIEIKIDNSDNNFNGSWNNANGKTSFKQQLNLALGVNYIYIRSRNQQNVSVPNDTIVIHRLWEKLDIQLPDGVEFDSISHSQILKSGDDIYIIGGKDRVKIYKYNNSEITKLPGTLRRPTYGAASALINNQIYLLGGFEGDNYVSTMPKSQLDIYDLNGNPIGSPLIDQNVDDAVKAGSTSVLINDGTENNPIYKLLMFGGFDHYDERTNNISIYNLSSNTEEEKIEFREEVPELAYANSIHYNDKIYIFNGEYKLNGSREYNSFVYECDLSGDRILKKIDSSSYIQAPRKGAGVAKVGDFAYILGGRNDNNEFESRIERFDLRSPDDGFENGLTVKSRSPLPINIRVRDMGITTMDDKIILFGGVKQVGYKEVKSNNIYIYHPLKDIIN